MRRLLLSKKTFVVLFHIEADKKDMRAMVHHRFQLVAEKIVLVRAAIEAAGEQQDNGGAHVLDRLDDGQQGGPEREVLLVHPAWNLLSQKCFMDPPGRDESQLGTGFHGFAGIK